MTRNTINHEAKTLLLTLVVLLLAGCNAPICQDCIDRRDTPVFTTFDPLPSNPSRAAPVDGNIYYKVLRIIDGDSLTFLDDTGTEMRLRMVGIDCPELRPLQPYALDAKKFVEELIEKGGGHIRIVQDGDGTDRFNRVRGHVYLMIDDNEIWLNEKLVRQGYAISVLSFRQSDGSKKALVEAEIDSRRNRRGMWSLSNPPFL